VIIIENNVFDRYLHIQSPMEKEVFGFI